MYKEHQLVDRRELLRIKIKSLAEEARIIRHEEKRTHGYLREDMVYHRRMVVRAAARSTHLAYGFIRGLTHEQLEPTRHTEPDWMAVQKMVRRYGPKELREVEYPQAAWK